MSVFAVVVFLTGFPVAYYSARYNIDLDQMLAAVTTLRNAGVKPSTVATGLRQAMLEVFNPDTKLTKALKERYAQLGEDMSEEMIAAR